jgi:hypothetical protein
VTDPLTIAEAAARAGVSERTIRRRLHSQSFPGAHRSGPQASAHWLIPTGDLTAAGFDLSAGGRPEIVAEAVESVPAVVTPRQAELIEQLEAQLLEAERRLAEAEQRSAVAEALAEDRDRTIAGLLEAIQRIADRTPAAAPQDSRRRWPWSRRSAG